MRMDVDDETLARQAGNGDGPAFSALLERHYDRLFALCFRLMGNRAEAEDLTQDICAGLAAKLAGFRGRAHFTTWLHRVAVNAAHDRRRRRARLKRAADGWGDWERARHVENAEQQAAILWLHEAMRTLPPELRDTLALTLDEELTHREAAGVLGISEGTVSWRMAEIRKRLRAMHEQDANT